MTQYSDGVRVRRNLLIWLGLVVGGAGFALGAASNPSALRVFWTRDSFTSLAVLAATALLAAVLQRLSRRSVPFVVLVGAVVALAAFGVAAAATVALILISCYALGAWLLEWTQHKSTESIGVDVFGVTTVGLAACSLWLGLTAHVKINVPLGYLALCAVSIALGRRHVIGLWNRLAATASQDEQDRVPLVVSAALWFAFGLHVGYSALPERYIDALAMHLVIPRTLELFGRWHFDVGEYVWAVQPMGSDWLFAWAYVLAGEYAAKLLNAAFLVLICGILVEAGAVSRRHALVAAAIFVLMPVTFIETASLFVENALTLFIVAAVVFAARIRESPTSASVAAFAVVSAGAIAVKLHGVVALAATCLALLVLGGWRDVFRGGRRTAVVMACVAVAALWVYGYAWRKTGNPVFPYFNGIFKSELYPAFNFTNFMYPGGVSLSDFFDLTFRSSKYLEAWDGALGFAVPLLLPAGLLLVAVAGSQKLRVITLATITYAAIVLLNTRYLRYIFPIFPLLALIMVYPFAVVRGPYARGALLFAALIGIGWGIVRIPSGGWILGRFNLASAFSATAKEAIAEHYAPLRKLGRVQAALGDTNSRVVIFGHPVGADIRGRPIFVGWYYPKLEAMVMNKATPEEAANALAALNATHVIFDLTSALPQWAPWQEATKKYGRLILSTAIGELYEFHAAEVPGIDVLGGPPGPWQLWHVSPKPDQPTTGANLVLPPGAAVSRAADVTALPDGAQTMLSANLVCEARTMVRAQINWIDMKGTIVRTDAAQSNCSETPTRAGVRGAKPKTAGAAFFYFVNDGKANARLDDERAITLVKP